MSAAIGRAMKEQDPSPVREMALAETRAGMDYLDLNIGPARKNGAELMTWLVGILQQATDTPLSLDTTNTDAIASGLKVCKKKAIVNSVSLQPERLERLLPLAKEHDADIIGLLWGPEGMPRDANERCMLAVDLIYKANQVGISTERIWIDPIVTPISVEINQVKACMEFMSMLAEIAPGCRSIVGLSNVSNGAPSNLRPYLNRTFLMMLMRYGLYAAIADAFDAELIEIARGGRQEVVSLVHRMMDGQKPDMSSLHPEEVKYAKTVRVLTGETLYSHSWLEI